MSHVNVSREADAILVIVAYMETGVPMHLVVSLAIEFFSKSSCLISPIDLIGQK